MLDNGIGTLLKNEDRRLIGHFDPQASEYVFSVAEKPPLDWGIAVSELLHHLRATLDNLVWALVEKRGGTPRIGVTAFPILDEEADWKPRKDGRRGKEERRIEGVSVEDRAIIESCQPYKYRFHDPSSEPANDDSMVPFHPLAQLRELNNADKHRFLLPSLVAPASAQPIREDGVIWELNPIQDVEAIDLMRLRYVWGVSGDEGTEIVRVPITASGPDPKVEMKTEPAFVVSLANGNPMITLEVVGNIAVYVEEQVFDRFAPAFDG